MAHKQFACILIFAMGICLTPLSFSAGGNPAIVVRPVPTHRFLDAQNMTLLSLTALMMVADVATTKRALQVPGSQEANPLMQSQQALIPLKVAGVGAGMGLAYLMHRTGHHHAERLVPIIFGAPSAISAVHNAGIHR